MADDLKYNDIGEDQVEDSNDSEVITGQDTPAEAYGAGVAAYQQAARKNKDNGSTPYSPIAAALSRTRNSAQQIPGVPGSISTDPGTPGITRDQAYPSAPVRMQDLPGRYFGATPIFLGGQPLYPVSLEEARRRSNNDYMASQEQARQQNENTLFTNLTRQKVAPAYQEKADKMLDDLYDDYSKTFAQKGRYGAVAAYNDPNSPEFKEFTQKYHNYLQSTEAINHMDTLLSQAQQRPPDELSPATKAQIIKFQTGGFMNPDGTVDTQTLQKSYVDLAKYMGYDGIIKSIAPYIAKDSESFFQQGAKDANGKEISPLDNDHQFITEVKKNPNWDKLIDSKYVPMLLSHAGLNPALNDPKAAHDYLKQILPEFVEKHFYDVQRSSASAGENKVANEGNWVVDFANQVRGSNVDGAVHTGGENDNNPRGVMMQAPGDMSTNITNPNFLKYIVTGQDANGNAITAQDTRKTIVNPISGLWKDNSTGDIYKVPAAAKNPTTGDIDWGQVRTPANKVTNMWTDVIVPYYRSVGGTGAETKLTQIQKKMWTQQPQEAQALGIPPLPKGGNAAPAASAPAKTIVRTGVDKTGKKVVQYSDGTVGYAQ
jgi:hypothetical protein